MTVLEVRSGSLIFLEDNRFILSDPNTHSFVCSPFSTLLIGIFFVKFIFESAKFVLMIDRLTRINPNSVLDLAMSVYFLNMLAVVPNDQVNIN